MRTRVMIPICQSPKPYRKQKLKRNLLLSGSFTYIINERYQGHYMILAFVTPHSPATQRQDWSYRRYNIGWQRATCLYAILRAMQPCLTISCIFSNGWIPRKSFRILHPRVNEEISGQQCVDYTRMTSWQLETWMWYMKCANHQWILYSKCMASHSIIQFTYSFRWTGHYTNIISTD